MPSGAGLVSTKGASNSALWARNATDTLFTKVTGDKYHTFYGAHPKFVGLDITIVNNGGAVASVTLDGIQFNIAAGVSRTITNFPFVELVVTSATNLDIVIQGMLWDVGLELGYLVKGDVCIWQ